MAEASPRLVGISGPLKGATFPIDKGEVTIGRDPSNQVWIADPSLSRRHCILTREGERVLLRDLRSHNGTEVNGAPVAQHELRHQDRIAVGGSVLAFLVEDTGAPVSGNWSGMEDGENLTTRPVLLRNADSVYLNPVTQFAAPPEMARVARDFNSLLTIATKIGTIREMESLNWQLLGMLFDLVPADRGAILHLEETSQFSSVAAWDRVRGPANPVEADQKVLGRLLQDRAGLLLTDVADESEPARRLSLVKTRARSVLCVPLMMAENVAGAIYLDREGASSGFEPSDLQVMTAVASIASLAMDNVRHMERLREENRQLRAEISVEHNMVGQSPRMKDVYQLIQRVAPTDSTVLIQGESGTGKELVARAIHNNSRRSERPFVAINCAAIAETLLESELFGHEKGSFTGATAQKKGKVEIAEGGTLFLDEIGELAPGLQAKLLRVLQEREVERIGGQRPIKVNIRLVAATNQNLQEAVQAGRFRGDLYYRLNVVAVTMPALRERREDIPKLAEHFMQNVVRKVKARPKRLSREAEACLLAYDWPGNVRELENAIERAVVLGASDVILPEDLPEPVLDTASSAVTPTRYQGNLQDTKRQLVLHALQQAEGNYIEAAGILGLHPNSLLRLIRNLGLKGVAKSLSTPGRTA